MNKLKLMLRSGYSIDAIFELRKTPIIISLIFGIFLSMMQMTPFAFSLLKDDTYRWDEKIWELSDEDKTKIVESLPDYYIKDGKLSSTEFYEINVNNDIKILFNGDENSITNGLVFNQDHLIFVENGRQYTLSYVPYEGTNFGDIRNMEVSIAYDSVFAPFAKALKPIFIVPYIMGNYQTGVLTFFIYTFVVAALSMLFKFGHTSFISYKEVLNIMIYSGTIPSVIALILGLIFTPAFTTIIFNFGTPIIAYIVYVKKVIPSLI